MLELTNIFKGRHVQVVDNSDAYSIVGVRGASARNILAKGCTLDLHERVFRSGCSTRTLLGQVQVILRQVTDEPDYEIHVHRSFAEFLWEWLVDAGQEYGLKTVRP
jgi:sarcosine oxidase subunit gamma